MIEKKVEIIYKNIKHINLKVRPDLKVVLSAPYKTDIKRIRSFIKKKENWIDDKLEWFKENRIFEAEKKYVNGENFTYLGRNYRLKYIQSNLETVKLKNGFLTIYTNRKNDLIHIKTMVDQWYYDHSYIVFESLLKKWSEKTSLFPNTFRIKKMKTRWGSCNSLKKNININMNLIKKQRYCIEYVILHELIHLKYNHHKKSFYDQLSVYMPDWKHRKKKLENA